ncbi:conserved hypothetical protein [Neospora caninum Liverpool]|uniref:Uncharacterized protein n=1 Tax=Neospora caninum (strain Liverpool) TaxID=572307 RepID=F0VDR4_NEOCL|nr:conserved hypothetical protein [Neospora caninum Liverpool]CBZ51857.1 conserved hypothetical protein [Neospora caninum Liverpool]CEL65814.1 TPA: hypothetical protein BN1204_016490 [Neospora caninum Liverpool]|eukprot:XP_003881890.1 conserved hypothetical protein [Neospora caninum Liverpool]
MSLFSGMMVKKPGAPATASTQSLAPSSAARPSTARAAVASSSEGQGVPLSAERLSSETLGFRQHVREPVSARLGTSEDRDGEKGEGGGSEDLQSATLRAPSGQNPVSAFFPSLHRENCGGARRSSPFASPASSGSLPSSVSPSRSSSAVSPSPQSSAFPFLVGPRLAARSRSASHERNPSALSDAQATPVSSFVSPAASAAAFDFARPPPPKSLESLDFSASVDASAPADLPPRVVKKKPRSVNVPGYMCRQQSSELRSCGEGERMERRNSGSSSHSSLRAPSEPSEQILATPAKSPDSQSVSSLSGLARVPPSRDPAESQRANSANRETSPRLQVRTQDGADEAPQKRLASMPSPSASSSDDRSRSSTSVQGAPKLEVAGSCGAPKLEVAGSCGAPKLEVAGSCGAPKLEVAGSCGAPKLEVAGSCGAPKLEVAGSCGAPKLEVAGSCGAPASVDAEGASSPRASLPLSARLNPADEDASAWYYVCRADCLQQQRDQIHRLARSVEIQISTLTDLEGLEQAQKALQEEQEAHVVREDFEAAAKVDVELQKLEDARDEKVHQLLDSGGRAQLCAVAGNAEIAAKLLDAVSKLHAQLQELDRHRRQEAARAREEARNKREEEERKLNQEAAALQERVRDCEEAAQTAARELTALAAREKAIEEATNAELNRLDDTQANTQAQMEDLRRQLAALEAECERRAAKIAELREERSRVQADFRREEEELLAAQALLHEHEKSLEKEEDKLHRRRGALDELARAAEEEEQAFQAATSALSASLASFPQRLRFLRGLKKFREFVQTHLRASLSSAALEEAQDRMRRLGEERHELQEHLRKWEERRLKLRGEQQQQLLLLPILEQEKALAVSSRHFKEAASFSAEIKQCQEAVETLNASLDACTAEIRQSQQSLDALEPELRLLRSAQLEHYRHNQAAQKKLLRQQLRLLEKMRVLCPSERDTLYLETLDEESAVYRHLLEMLDNKTSSAVQDGKENGEGDAEGDGNLPEAERHGESDVQHEASLGEEDRDNVADESFFDAFFSDEDVSTSEDRVTGSQSPAEKRDKEETSVAPLRDSFPAGCRPTPHSPRRGPRDPERSSVSSVSPSSAPASVPDSLDCPALLGSETQEGLQREAGGANELKEGDLPPLCRGEERTGSAAVAPSASEEERTGDERRLVEATGSPRSSRGVTGDAEGKRVDAEAAEPREEQRTVLGSNSGEDRETGENDRPASTCRGDSGGVPQQSEPHASRLRRLLIEERQQSDQLMRQQDLLCLLQEQLLQEEEHGACDDSSLEPALREQIRNVRAAMDETGRQIDKLREERKRLQDPSAVYRHHVQAGEEDQAPSLYRHSAPSDESGDAVLPDSGTHQSSFSFISSASPDRGKVESAEENEQALTRRVGSGESLPGQKGSKEAVAPAAGGALFAGMQFKRREARGGGKREEKDVDAETTHSAEGETQKDETRGGAANADCEAGPGSAEESCRQIDNITGRDNEDAQADSGAAEAMQTVRNCGEYSETTDNDRDRLTEHAGVISTDSHGASSNGDSPVFQHTD